MATRLFPVSAFPATEGKVYPEAFNSVSHGFWIEGLGVMANLNADAELHYVFQVPNPLPAGIAKLEVVAMAYDGAGSAKFNPKWKSIALGETFDLAAGSLNAEGTQTLTWVAGDGLKFKRAVITLDADTVVADEFVALRLAMETTDWTLNQRSLWLVAMLWE